MLDPVCGHVQLTTLIFLLGPTTPVQNGTITPTTATLQNGSKTPTTPLTATVQNGNKSSTVDAAFPLLLCYFFADIVNFHPV